MSDMILVEHARFRLKRDQAGITQLEIAQRSGVPRAYVTEYEKGRRILSPDHLEAIQRALAGMIAEKAG